MPSFDVYSEMDWPNLTNAVQQCEKEASTRYDFKGVKFEFKVDQKQKTMSIWCSDPAKYPALYEMFQNKAVKRGLSLLSFVKKKEENATGGSVRQNFEIQAGVSKEKGKEIISLIKDSKLKVQAQIQDEQVRVTGKSRDDLQSVIALLKGQQEKLGLPLQFGNFRD